MISKSLQNKVGEEYLRRKFYRIVSTWIADTINSHEKDYIRSKIINDESFIDELEQEFHMQVPKNQILSNLEYIELYRNSITESDIMNIAKKTKYQLFDFNNELNKNPIWLTNLCQDCLLRFLSYVEEIRKV